MRGMPLFVCWLLGVVRLHFWRFGVHFLYFRVHFLYFGVHFWGLGVHFLFRGVHSVSTKLPTCIILHNFASQPGENGALLLTLKSFLASAEQSNKFVALLSARRSLTYWYKIGKIFQITYYNKKMRLKINFRVWKFRIFIMLNLGRSEWSKTKRARWCFVSPTCVRHWNC